jgi:hypothetical protein
MTDWAQLGGNPIPVEPDELGALARGLDGCRLTWSAQADRVMSTLVRVQLVWDSDAGRAWADACAAAAGSMTPVLDRLGEAVSALWRYGGMVADLQDEALRLACLARSYQDEIDSLTHHVLQPVPLLLPPSPKDELIIDLRARLETTRTQARELHLTFIAIQRNCARQLEELSTAGITAPGHAVQDAELATLSRLAALETAGDVAGIGVLLSALPPEQLVALFTDLTAEATTALAAEDPAVIGNLDGVPLKVRAIANRGRAEADLATARAAKDSARVAMLESLLSTENPGAQLSLIMYDPAHDHYGVLWGDPAAANIGVLVPGVGDDGSVAGWVNDARNLWAAAPGSAVILWKGYDNPGDHGLADKANAALDDRARAGAKSLAALCGTGLGLGTQQSLTVVAHSYGSVVTGLALAEDGLKAARVVTAGSPGMTVDGVAGLHLPRGQFYAERAPGDYVANDLTGFGPDPAAPGFGGTRLATNGPGMPGVSGHSSYFTPRSQAIKGIADVITGHVATGDLQPPTPGDPAAGLTRDLLDGLNPANALLELTHGYDGPGHQLLELNDHADQALTNNAATGARILTDKAADGARKVIEDLEDGLTRWIP